jgi:uncharacterized protein
MKHQSTRTCVQVCLLLMMVAVSWHVALAAAALPASQGYVTDLAAVLDTEAKTEIEARVHEVEQRTSAEIAVATVPSLDGMSVEEYANRLFQAWGIGKKGSDNGVLILVAPTERKIRIEVGYGLEPILPDGLAGEIIRDQVLPAFRTSDYAGGIRASVDRVAAIVEANHTLTAEERQQLVSNSSTSRDSEPSGYVTTPFFGMFVVIGALALGAGLRAKVIFLVLFGSLFAGLPLLMALLPFFHASRLLITLLGLATFTLGYLKGGSPAWMEASRGTGGRRSRKGRNAKSDDWIMGGSSSSSSSSGSSSSGSSFGGGSSGGGGASGSW